MIRIGGRAIKEFIETSAITTPIEEPFRRLLGPTLISTSCLLPTVGWLTRSDDGSAQAEDCGERPALPCDTGGMSSSMNQGRSVS